MPKRLRSFFLVVANRAHFCTCGGWAAPSAKLLYFRLYVCDKGALVVQLCSRLRIPGTRLFLSPARRRLSLVGKSVPFCFDT
jgi:hypothetical protein